MANSKLMAYCHKQHHRFKKLPRYMNFFSELCTASPFKVKFLERNYPRISVCYTIALVHDQLLPLSK